MEMTLPPSPYDVPRRDADTPLFRRYSTWLLIVVFTLIAGQNSWFTEGISQSKQLADFKHTYDTSSPILAVLTLIIYILAAGIGLRYARYLLPALLRQKTILLFGLFAAFSLLWSQVPGVSLRGLPLLVSLITLGWYVALYYKPEEQIRITLTIGFFFAFFGAFLAIVLPRYGLDSDGEWKGMMGTKNQFGHAMLFLFSGILYRNDRRNRVFWFSAGLLGLGCLVMARSAESVMLYLILVGVRLYGPLLRRAPRDKQPFLIFAAVVGILTTLIGRVALLDLFGKDTTLTGRTNEWATIMPFAMNHFWLGYGFKGFWTGDGDSLRVMQLVRGSMHGADSGYLDLLLQFGVIGLTLALLIMLIALWQFARMYVADRAPLISYWYFSLILVSFIGNYADAYFPLTGGAPEIMLIMSFATLWKLSLRKATTSRVAMMQPTSAAFS